jgi:SAM-dependent methyltransferase
LRDFARCAQPRILELCSGDGRFAERILQAVPVAEYVALDDSSDLCAFVAKRLNIKTVLADLTSGNRYGQVASCFDAILTMQSMHDVGGPEVIEAVYRRCYGQLNYKGRMLAADFVVPVGKVDPDRPGRLPVEWHLGLLENIGYESVRCVEHAGAIACVSGIRK